MQAKEVARRILAEKGSSVKRITKPMWGEILNATRNCALTRRETRKASAVIKPELSKPSGLTEKYGKQLAIGAMGVPHGFRIEPWVWMAVLRDARAFKDPNRPIAGKRVYYDRDNPPERLKAYIAAGNQAGAQKRTLRAQARRATLDLPETSPGDCSDELTEAAVVEEVVPTSEAGSYKITIEGPDMRSSFDVGLAKVKEVILAILGGVFG